MKRIGLIMAGGSGERFWPLSRKNFPKQLLHLNSEEHSIIEETLIRISSFIPCEDIFIITNELLVDEIRNCLPQLPPRNVIPEPCKRNTAPCLALASAFILARYENLTPAEISIAVLTADQNIFPDSKFIATVEAAVEFAEEKSQLVTIGIPPTRPDTGFGYIETAKPFDMENEVIEIQKVECFKEKPNVEQAQEFIKTKRYTWNSGMFFWRLDVFMDELVEHSREIGDSILNFAENLKNKTAISYKKMDDIIIATFSALPSISIDYALMEKSKNVSVCRAIFEWDDIGSWDSLDRTKKRDANGNVRRGRLSIIDCNNSIFINECKTKEVIVAGLGLEEMVVITTDDAILVCPKNKVQSIKSTVEDIRNQFNEKHL